MKITVPEFGESVSSATVVNLIKQTGDIVAKGDDIVELETDKVNSVIPAPESGELTLSVKLEDVVTSGQEIGHITPSDQPPSAQKEEKPKAAPKKKVAQSGPSARSSHEAFLETIHQTPKKAPTPAPRVESGGKRKKMSQLRKTIANHLVKVKNETAMLTTFNEVDMSEVMRIRAKEKEAFAEKHGVKLGFMSFFIKACVSGLRAFSDVGAAIDGDEIVYPDALGVGIAVSTERGLMVPVIKGCEALSFAQIEQALAQYASQAREGKIALDALKGGCFTITNGGVFGSLVSTPIINAGQSAILGMHAIQKRAVVVEDEIVIRPMMYLALSYDHRIVDGKEAIGFLVHVKENLEEPSRLLLDF